MGKMGQGSVMNPKLKYGQGSNSIHHYSGHGVNDAKGDQKSTGARAGKGLHGNKHPQYAVPNRSKKTGKKSRKIVIAA